MGGGYEYFETEDKGGLLTVAACVSNGASRHAMPTIPELVYAALLYHEESPENENFEPGTQTNGEDGNVKLVFSFQRPEDTRGTFTLEVFAFIKSDIVAEDGTTNFSRNGALLSGKKDGCAIEGDTINVSEPIELSSSEQGTVSLKIKVPDDCTLKINNTNFHCEKDEDTSDTYIVSASGIPADAYQVTFTVKKKVRESEEIICVFSEYINVFNGLCTDTWDGLAKGAAKEISQSMISSTVYVRGTGGWYETSPYEDTATANDDNLGSFLSPLATIQKAIDKIIAINDGSSAYTIYVDGTLKYDANTYIGEKGMADFSAFNENLNLTIKALSGTATLDGGAVFNADGTVKTAGIDKSIIYARPGTNGALNLTLEKLVITGGTDGGVTGWNCGLAMNDCEVIRCIGSSSGGGVYVDGSGTFMMNGGTISGCTAKYGGGVYVNSGTFTAEKCVFSGNIANEEGGAIYINTNATATITDDEIKGNEAKFGGGSYVSGGKLEMKNCKVEGNIATSYCAGGIRVYNGGTVIMDGGTISRNEVRGATSGENYGGGIYIDSGKFTMKGDAIISGNILASTTYSYASGVYVTNGTFEMESGVISKGNANYGGGVYVHDNSTFTMNGGEISDCTVTKFFGGGVYVCPYSTFTMNGGKIIDNNTTNNGGGVYVCPYSTFTMNGGKIIDNNTTNNGGGVYAYNSTFTMNGGDISRNTASNDKGTNALGGGVYISSAIFTMNGGTISGGNARFGGGVYVNNGTFTMEGGTISGNNATNRGSGVYIDASSMLNMSGNAKAESDNDVYLYGASNKITITGALSAATPVATITPSAYTANRQVLSAGDGVTLNGSICNKFAVKPQADGTEWRVALDGADGVLIRKYALRDTGPGGGAVCYYDSNGFTVNGKTCHYLECSKETIGLSLWCPCNLAAGCSVTTSAVIGAGYANTQAILDHPNHASATAANCAAKLCANYSTSTTNAGEWFLPSNNEANRIYKGVSIISSEDIWSSRSEFSNTAYCVNLQSNGTRSVSTVKNTACFVRAMRAF